MNDKPRRWTVTLKSGDRSVRCYPLALTQAAAEERAKSYYPTFKVSEISNFQLSDVQ